VEDTGPGIPDEDLTRVFDPFYTTRSGGTGLGLAIVARIVQAHRGIITVQSQMGEGTAFAIWLPVDDVGDDEAFVETVIVEDDEDMGEP
jgi:signal transduction histidine kinase